MSKRTSKAKVERRQHTPEFRVEALALAEKVGVAAAARDLELHDSQVYSWRSKAQAQRNKTQVEQDQALEIAKLKRKLADQEEELAILKKLQRNSLSRVLDVSRSSFYAW